MQEFVDVMMRKVMQLSQIVSKTAKAVISVLLSE